MNYSLATLHKQSKIQLISN